MRCCSRSRSGCAASSAIPISWRASAATSSSCCRPPLRNPEAAATLARRIVEELSNTYDVDGHRVVIGASVGIAVAPRDGTGADVLLKNADMALYRAKSDGRGAWRFFEPEMDVKAQARRSLELDLRDAVATGAFEVYYQPLINLKTRASRPARRCCAGSIPSAA